MPVLLKLFNHIVDFMIQIIDSIVRFKCLRKKNIVMDCSMVANNPYAIWVLAIDYSQSSIISFTSLLNGMGPIFY